MYSNLKFEMERNNIDKNHVAEFLEIDMNSLNSKLDGKEFFKFYEAFMIQHKYFPKLTMEYLFKSDIKSSY